MSECIKIVVREQREWLYRGNPRPVAEIHDAIETLIEDQINARVQDAISEFGSNETSSGPVASHRHTMIKKGNHHHGKSSITDKSD